MKLLSVLALLEGASFALATATTKCNADNCARAVTGTYASLQGTHLADCKSFQKTTVYPPTTTVYATATVYPSTFTTYITTTTSVATSNSVTSLFATLTTYVTSTVTAGPSVTVTATAVPRAIELAVIDKRTASSVSSASGSTSTLTPSSVPTYASACSGVVRYSSACSCAGVTPTTVTMPTPTTTITNTVSLTTTITSDIAYTSTMTDIHTSQGITINTVTITSTVTPVPVPTGDAYCENGSSVLGEAACPVPGCSTLNLRIEGATDTIYEGKIGTAPGLVTTPSGGTHECDGTNNNANPNPGSTATTALQSAAGICGFGFDGTFDSDFDDFFITSIGPSAETATEFWGLLTNLAFTPTGGCQTEVSSGSVEILWAFNAFNAVSFLTVSPNTATLAAGSSMVFNVQGSDGSGALSPVQGAVFGVTTSDATGNVVYIAPTTPGYYRVKATRSDSIRSAAVMIHVV